MPCDTTGSAQKRRLAWSCLGAAFLILSACTPPQTGVATGAKSNYQSIAVVPRLNDRLLTAYWAKPLGEPSISESKMGWNAARDAGEISREILSQAGASVSVASNATSREARTAQVVVVLEQTPLDALASNYDPGRDFLISAVSIAGAASAGGMGYIVIDSPNRYEPRSVLRITNADGENRNNPNVWVVGLTPYLVDPTSGETIRKGRSLFGAEKLPGTFSGRSWSTFSAAEKQKVLIYCQSALRRVVSQSFMELDLVN